MPRLSVTVIALNEEAHIGPCLESVRWADELVVVVDTASTDRTREVARTFTDRIFETDWQGFAGTKNFALDQARMDWVFSLDADERVPPALKEEILQVVQADGPLAGYRVPRKNYFCGRWIRHLGWYPDYTLRLFRRSQGRFRERQVHEEVQVAGPVGKLRTPLEHYTYKDVSDYLKRMDRYARLAAGEMAGKGKRPYPGELVWRPFFTFLNLFFLRRGFLEGSQGYTLAVLGSQYNFLKYYYLRELTPEATTHDH
jgi:glycosyltransferase involved in cell wall biosynthesis